MIPAVDRDPLPANDDDDVCTHGRPFDVICVECCPEDDDGSFTGDEWSEG